MEKWIKIILYVVIALVIINVIALFFGNSNIKSIRQDLERAKVSADSALVELQFSKSKLDSIKSDLLIFKSYIGNIQKTVELNDAEKRLKEEKNAAKVAEIKENIKKLREEIETDSLPDIELTTLKNNWHATIPIYAPLLLFYGSFGSVYNNKCARRKAN